MLLETSEEPVLQYFAPLLLKSYWETLQKLCEGARGEEQEPQEPEPPQSHPFL